MNWVLIIVIYTSYSPQPTYIKGFTEQGCKEAAHHVRRTQHAKVTCVEER